MSCNDRSQNCGACVYSKHLPKFDTYHDGRVVDTLHECRRKSPEILKLEGFDGHRTIFPIISAKDWCGEFVDRETKDDFDGE